MASSSCIAFRPPARRTALRNHCRPNTSRTVPTTSRSESIGRLARAGPRPATMTTNPATAAATPHPADRQPRVTPTARTIVRASTISTADAKNAAATRRTLCIATSRSDAVHRHIRALVVYATTMAQQVASATDSYADRVAERGESLAPAERRVADLLLDLGPEATLLSAAALAEQLGTSDATVVRTAKALGYSGLAELRRALAAYGESPPLGERLRRTLEQTPDDELFPSVIRNHLSALETLTRNVTPQAFQDAVAI